MDQSQNQGGIQAQQHSAEEAAHQPSESEPERQEALTPASVEDKDANESSDGGATPDACDDGVETVEMETTRATRAEPVAMPPGTSIGPFTVEGAVHPQPARAEYLARRSVTLDTDTDNSPTDSNAPTTTDARYLLVELPLDEPMVAARARQLVTMRLAHPRLLTPRETIPVDGHEYVALGTLPVSEDLAQPAESDGWLTLTDMLRAGAGLADGLAYLHRNGLAHLHVSPDAILVQDSRAYLRGLDQATHAPTGIEESSALFARDANFLARTLGVLAQGTEPVSPEEEAIAVGLRGLAARGEAGEIASADDLAAACGALLRSATQPLDDADAGAGSARLHYRCAVATTVGRVRSQNQDAMATALLDVRDDLTGDSPVGVFLVADGMGGEAHGEIASRIGARIVVAEFVRTFAAPLLALPATAAPQEETALGQNDLRDVSLAQAIVRAAVEANRQVRSLAEHLGQSTGTTLTAIAVHGSRAALAHVGDSRAYLLHGETLVQLTEDHSLLARLQAMDHPLLNDPAFAVPRNFLYRSLGQEDETPPDSLEFTLEPGDRLMLCSDGLWDEVDDATIGAIMVAAATPEEAAHQLVEQANEAGGHDNSTAVVVFVEAAAPSVEGARAQPEDGGSPDDVEHARQDDESV